MTVARDAFLKRAPFTTSSPANLTFTPVGTPRGVVVFIGHGTESTDLITGVTYGGVAMTRIDFAQDTGGEPGAVYAYFLGASIPTGAQTVAVSHTGTATSKWMIVASVTAAGDTEIGVFGKIEGDAANPQIALDTGAASSLRYCINYTGHDAVASLTVLSGMEAIVGGAFNDFGTFVAILGQQTTASTGSFTIGYTATSEDVAMVAVAIKEVGTLFTISPIGSITPTGALTKSTSKALAGSSTPAGSLAKAISKAFTGSITGVGTITKVSGKLLAGSITAAGDLSLLKAIVRVFTGSITATGALTKTIAKTMAGSITAVGNLINQIATGFVGWWRRNPVGHSKNPAGFDRIESDQESPW